jgi:hypothetical protein
VRGGLETCPLPESRREIERIIEAHGFRDRRDFLIRGGKQVAGALDAEEGEMLAGGAPQFPKAKPPEVLHAHRGDGRHLVDRPMPVAFKGIQRDYSKGQTKYTHFL